MVYDIRIGDGQDDGAVNASILQNSLQEPYLSFTPNMLPMEPTRTPAVGKAAIWEP